MEKYLVLGAGPNPMRLLNKAIKSLIRPNKQVGTVGFWKGSVSEVNFPKGLQAIDKIECIVGCTRVMINGGQL